MLSNKRKLLLCSVTLIVPLLLSGCNGGYGSGQQAAFAGAKAHELGVYHFQQGHYGLAIQHFERATKKGESMVESLNGLGASYDQLGRFDIAESYYRRALRLDPQSAQTLNNMGYSYWMQARYDLALAFLRDADKLDEGNRLIAANRALASASLQEDGGSLEIDQLAALEKATAAVEEPAFKSKRGVHLERTSSYEQRLVLQPEAVPAAFEGLPETVAVAPFGEAVTTVKDDGSLSLPLSYLADQAALGLPAYGLGAADESDDFAQPMETAADQEPALERNQMAVVSLVAVEATPLPALQIPAAAERPQADRMPAESFVAAFAPETPADLSFGSAPESFIAETPYAAVPSAEPEAPVVETASAAAPLPATEAADDRATGFLASLLAGIQAFFTADPVEEKVVVASTDAAPGAWTEAYVGPYGTEAGGRHHSLGLARPDQYAVAHPKIELSDASGLTGTALRVGSYLQGRGLPVEQGQPADAAALPASYRPASYRTVTAIFYDEGWEAYASGLAATLPAAVELRPSAREGEGIRIEVGADLVDFDRDATAEDSSRRDDISG